MKNLRIRNKLKIVAKSKGVNNRLIAIVLGVHYTTVSHWMSNLYQPSNINIGKLLDLLEVDYNDLIIVENNVENTGLGKALQKAYDSAIKVNKLPLYVIEDNKMKKEKYNPEIIKILIKVESEHKKQFELKKINSF